MGSINPEVIVGTCSNPIHCKYKGPLVDDSSYRYKGCWNCPNFIQGTNYPYYSVKEAAKYIGCSESTIYRWIKTGLLKSEIFKPIRMTGIRPPRDKIHLFKEEVEKKEKEYDLDARLKHIYQLCEEGRRGGDYDYKNDQFKEIMAIISRYFTARAQKVERW